MSEEKKLNLAGIAAIITAIGGLVGAIALFNKESDAKSGEPIAAAAEIKNSDDFCMLFSQCAGDLKKDFKNIRGTEIPPTSDDRSIVEYESQLTLPGSVANHVNRYYGDDKQLLYFYTAVMLDTEDESAADIRYQEVNRELGACLAGKHPVISYNSSDESTNTVKSTVYQMGDGTQAVVSIEDYGNDGLEVMLTIQGY